MQRSGRVDYRMARRAVLRDVRSGMTSATDVRDAHPELLRAARWIGEAQDAGCPLCAEHDLVHVHYAFPRYGETARRGQAVTAGELPAKVAKLGDLRVYTVEVCRACHWHHLVTKFELHPGARAVGS
jgi:hypothetical protein